MTGVCSRVRLEKAIYKVCKPFEDPVEKLKCIIGWFSLRSLKDVMRRRLACGCIHACNGGPPPIVLAIEGTPPRGMLMLTDTDFEDLLFITQERPYACVVRRNEPSEWLYRVLKNLFVQVAERLCSEVCVSGLREE